MIQFLLLVLKLNLQYLTDSGFILLQHSVESQVIRMGPIYSPLMVCSQELIFFYEIQVFDILLSQYFYLFSDGFVLPFHILASFPVEITKIGRASCRERV